MSSFGGGIRNFVLFIGQVVSGATAGAPLAVDANGQLASGLTSDEASSAVDTTTTSSADVLISGMSLTPVAGTYLAWFSTSLDHSSQVVEIEVSLYVGGVKTAHSERRATCRTNAVGAQSLSKPVATLAKVVVNGSQAIEARWRTPSGTATAHERSLSILRVA